MHFGVTTLENPNIKGRDQAFVLEELKEIDPEMYDIIMTHRNMNMKMKDLH